MVNKTKNEESLKSLKNQNLEFQIVDWNSYHELDEEEEERYTIQLFGRTEDDKDVCLKVTGFTPFFYVEVPLSWNKLQADRFVDILKNKVSWSTKNNPNYDYDLSKSLVRHALVQKHKFYNFSNKKYFKFVMLVFNSHTAMREFSNVLARPLKATGLTKEPMLYQRYESNIEPHLRFMHINNLSSCGWVVINKSKLIENKSYSHCDLSYQVNWKEVKASSNDNKMAPLKIMGYDIECVSCDHNFPQGDRKTDKIIQIGITMYRYGSMNCYEQHMLALGECADIKGATVECYKTERGLIKGFARKIQELRPDFKAGYNNFGFDDKYIFDRINRIDKADADKQGITVDGLPVRLMDEFLEIMGKVNNKYLMENEGLKKSLTYYEVKNLSSSALGDNELKFFQVPGILSIDMMKVIQRDHRLIGYKLDNVSANFITEDAIKFKEQEMDADGRIKVDIYTKSTKALEKDSYIQIMVDDSYSSTPLSEGAKYKVLDIVTITDKKDGQDITYQCIKTVINEKDITELREAILNPLLKIYWTFAKDDMHHTLINKYFKEGDPKKVRIVAKYCLKDCKLVNLLLAKLEIIVNSVGMAKVCHVPLSYLFLRGQGVKIFSLVSKKCKEKNFLIPVLRRKKADTDGDNEESYEGATVITPKPDVYLSPIGVLDYSSLYPNSMRERNLTQECYVNDPKYDNLPGYIYHDVYIVLKDKKGKILRNFDGTPQKEHHRFAQELITDEQINEELKDIFAKINAAKQANIVSIMDQTCLNETDKKNLSKIEEDKTNKAIKDVANDAKLSAKAKEKKIAELKLNLTNELKLINEKTDISQEFKQAKIDSENAEAAKKIAAEKAKKYNVVKGQTVRYGILPEILTELLNARKETNNKLGVEKDPFVKAILNSLQLAYKVTANSLYGQTGAPTSPIFFMAIAASTTAIGRERLHYAKKMVEENFPGSEVIYGDSVTGDTPLIIKDSNDEIDVTTIEKLGDTWKSYAGFKLGESNRKDKEQSIVDCEVWTADGWAKIKRVIRHKTSKKIYRVLTHTGCVDVTEDHSLLTPEREIIKPTKCKIGTELLHGFMEPNNTYDYISEKEAFVMGFFMGDGSCGTYKTKYGKKYTWALNNQDLKILNKCKKYLELVEGIDFKILNTMKSSHVYKLVPTGTIKYMVQKYRPMFYDHKKYKLIPKEILNGTTEVKQSFLDGYFAADGCRADKKNIGCLRCDIKGKISAQCLFYLIKSLGYNVSLNTRSDKDQIYRLTYTKSKQRRNSHAIKKIEYLRDTEEGEYVYDLETESGTFHAGIGELIVKNTDSIFINFHLKDADGKELTNKEALIKTIELSKQAAKLINDAVPKPQGIVYEKTLHPFILVAKKKYVGLLFNENPDKCYLKSMGIVLKRRDNAPIVKIVVGGIIDHLLKNRDVNKAIDYTKQVLRKLMDGKYPIDKFIISKTLKAKYKKPSTIAHKVLADRMAQRDPGNKPQINDRIPFVYVVTDISKKKKKDVLQGDLIEHPDFVIKNKLKIDYLYYLEHQIINPATQILELLLSTRKVEKLFNEFIIEEQNKRLGRQDMSKWLNDQSPKKSKSNTSGSKTSKISKSAKMARSLRKELEEEQKEQAESEMFEIDFGNESEIETDAEAIPSVKSISPKKEDIHKNPLLLGKGNGNSKKIDKQSMNRWLAQSTTTAEKASSDEWEPTFDE
jgi:DNA polymerase elongation subunit (family B)